MDQKPSETPVEIDTEEKDVGITEFISTGHSLLARYKSRYTDFLVNEIGQDGKVVTPPPRRDPNAKMEEEKKPEEPSTIELTTEQEDNFRKTLSPEDYKKLVRFIEEVNLSNPPKGFSVEMDCPEDKDTRKLFHQTVRSMGSSKLDSETFDISGRKMLRLVVLDPKAKRKRFDAREYPDKYLQFTLLKTNYDTVGAIAILGKFLQMRPNNFGIAGNKDKRGITVQRVTLFKSLAEDLEKTQFRKKWIDSLVMGDYSYVPKQLKIGDLKGNRFALGLRFVENYEDSVIAENVKGLNDHGFINYYGLQRFGVTNIKTHVVGKEVLKKNWKSVIELILSADDHDARADETKKNFLKNWNCKEALRTLPNKNKLDRSLIEGLNKYGVTSFRQAFMNLPRFIRELYGHAYQSYIWNKVVSRRISKYGKEPIVGDMILLGTDVDIEEDALEEAPLPETEEKAEEEQEDSKEDASKKARFDPTQVVVLTEETKKNYKLEDIIIPLVGREVPLPENNPITEIINEVLTEDGLTLKDFLISDQDVFFRGGYRKIIIKPEDIKWEVVRYNTNEKDLQNAYYFTEKEPESEPEGKFQAIRVKFNLPKSSYATMCVRELTKNSTSFAHQLKLNQLANKQA